MKLKEFIGHIILEASKHGIDAIDLEIDCIDVGSISSINFDSIDVFIDKKHKTITVYESDGL